MASNKSQSHVHCDTCDGNECGGVPERALPPREPTPEWVLKARAEGRAEFLRMLLETSAETFPDDHIGSHSIADTGDYGAHWEEAKLRELFEVDEPSYSLMDRIDSAYWTQRNEIDSMKEALKKSEREAQSSNLAFNAALNFALSGAGPEGLAFLTLWREGDWVAIRREFPAFILEKAG